VPGEFEGWPRAAFDVLLQLEGEPSVEVRRRWQRDREELERDGFEISGDQLKRPLRGQPADHPRAQLLRHRSLIATRALGCDDWIHTPAAADRVVTAFTQLRPLARWLIGHVSV